MSENFIRFKRRASRIRWIKSAMAGVAVGALTAGILILLWKLVLISLAPMYSALIGVGALAVSFTAVFFILHFSDASLARRLDRDLGLRERIGTMVAYSESDDGMHVIQRADADAVLSEIPTKKLKFKRLWLYITAILIGAAALTAGLVVKDGREIEEPEEIKPFTLSAMQEAGINELISYVSASGMKDPYKSGVLTELDTLLTALKAATTEPEMHAAMATALTEIATLTYDSSSSTEILGALWNTGGERMEALVTALDTSNMSEPTWGDFADTYSAFKLVMTDINAVEGSGGTHTDEDKISYVKWALEDVSIKISSGLLASGIKSGDPLYDVLTAMTGSGKIGEGASAVSGYAALIAAADGMSADRLIAAVTATVDGVSQPLFDAVSELKVNANTGEYVMNKLGSLFGVKVPSFERPSLKKASSSSDQSDESTSQGGGVGEGVQYGSNDLVLDPLTGKYVRYGELYAKYYSLMVEKLGDDTYGYTDEQKKAIEKYFALLYSGFKTEN